ncbi:cytoplasmic 60S subunit biogenesis factor REI1 homolog 1-like [Aristolochia californica]|uniref:cytoplasmic 60S subunit biogenesis factor REI1 homolog 1-like n=1 Tax=Aristolochia californica TaxID=171875 RepID=UPI0035DCC759
MGILTCNACNSEFSDEAEQKLHYRSDWHRYNLKRKVAGVPGVTEALFIARQSALAEQKNKESETPMLYECALCKKGYRSSKAHDQHLNSRSHAIRASQGQGFDPQSVGITVIKPLPIRKPSSLSKHAIPKADEIDESEDEWVEVDPDEELVDEATDSVTSMKVNEVTSSLGMEVDADNDEEGLDPSCCFMCDVKHKNIESCMVHMHKNHGFFIPDIEFLKDPEGFLTYVGLKVKKDFLCLYCNDRCQAFSSIEAVRKHIMAKGHCKVRYGDGSDDEDADLEDFYDYSSSYVDEDGKQLVAADDLANTVELGGGSELIITKRTDSRVSIRTLGSRQYLRYYRQKPRPSSERDMALAISLASRYQSLGLATVQSKQHIVRMKVLKEMNKSGVEVMRSKIGMKSNVIRNLPKNVPY